MKKILLTLGAVVASFLGVYAQGAAPEMLKANWANLSGNELMADITDMDADQNGNIFVLQGAYTDAANQNIYYGTKENAFKGSGCSTKPNGNPDLVLRKIGADGTLAYTVYSDKGYFYGAGSRVAATSDGGALMVLKMRLLDDAADADGKKIMLNFRNTSDETYSYAVEEPELPVGSKKDGWIYKGYLVKLDKNGLVEWHKNIWADYTPGDKDPRSDLLEFGGVVEGPDGNFYVAGKFGSTLHIEGTEKTFEANNFPEGWNFKGSYGNLFLTKFSASGEYKWTLTHKAGSYIACEQVQDIAKDEKAVYLTGYMNGFKAKALSTTFGDKKVDFDSEFKRVYLLKVDCDKNATSTDESVEVDIFKVFGTKANSKGKSNVKPVTMAVADGKVILGGSVTGQIADGENVVVDNAADAMLRGYAITLSAADGKVLAGVKKQYDGMISEVDGVFADNNFIYSYGYDLNKQCWLSLMDKETLVESKEYCLVKGIVTALPLASDGKNVTFASRGKTGFEIPGMDKIMPFGKSFGTVIFNFSLDQLSGVENAVAEESEFKAFATQGAVVVETAEACNVNVYNVAGSLVRSEQVEEGRTEIELPQGFYIVNGEKVLVR